MKKNKYLLPYLFIFIMFLSGCGSEESSGKLAKSNSIPQVENAPKPLSEPVDIKFGYPTQGASMLPLWVAKEMGIFEKYGVNAELIYIAGTPKVQETLNSDGIDVGLIGVDSVGKAKVAGIDSIILSAVADRISLYVYGQKDVNKSDIVNELKDKTIITAAEGSLYDHLAQDYIRDNDLTPKEDVNLLYMGGEGDRTAAFMKGDGDFYVVAPPTSFRMEEMGYPQLYDFKEKEVLSSGITMKTDYYNENPELAEILIASLIEANAFIINNKEETIEVISKWAGIDDPELAAKTYDVNVETIPKKPYISNESVQFLLDNSDNVEVRKMKPSDLVDTSLVKKLDESGFIDNLYK
jgi:NitT/TauT family transport system substrate-binding protein